MPGIPQRAVDDQRARGHCRAVQACADWLDGRKEQGPSLVLARAKRQMEELEVDWADAFAVPETESVTVPRPKQKRTEEPAATSHLPPAITASHTAKPPHPLGKVLAQKTADQQLLAHWTQRSRVWCGTPPILGVVNMVCHCVL